MTTPRWRIGRHYGIHVYEGDRPVATFARAEDAAEAVRHVNAVRAADAAFEGDAALGDDGLTATQRAELAEQWRHGAGGMPPDEVLVRARKALGIKSPSNALRRLAAEAGITVDTTTEEKL